jgi:CRISPR-associated endonuclease Cas1/CRISPR-associated protein Cas4
MSSEAPVSTDADAAAQPPLPVRRLHNFIYCPRLFYYQWVENLFEENADTVAGSHLHRNVDAPSRLENPADLGLPEGAKLRSLRLHSESLGLIGVVDIMEGGAAGVEVCDYKKGSARRDAQGNRVPKEADAMQVVAQALLIEEQGAPVTAGWIYYAEDRRRVPVPLDDSARERCREAIAGAKALAASGQCPPPLVHEARCLYCSAYPVCLPNESAWWSGHRQVPGAQPGQAEVAVAGEDAKPLPLPEQAPRPERDDGEVLVVQLAGAKVGRRGGEITVTVEGSVVKKCPVQQVRSIYLYGAVQLSAQAAQTCLEEGIDVAYFSPAGRFLGLLRGLPASGVDARLGQYRLFHEPGIRLRLAREIIRAKIHNQRVLLMRNGEPGKALTDQLAELRDSTAGAGDLSALLGIEGTAAALYFQAFGTMLKGAEAWRFDFNGRNRRPPRDPVNALLSQGYSILAKEISGVCHAVGLDPFMGFLHQPRYGRPALALDLMEEFRPLLADSVAISTINRGELVPADFVRSASGTFLTESGRRAFWEAWFRRMDAEVTHPQFGYKMSYRRMLEVQARQLWRFVRGEAAGYVPFTTR